MIDGGDIIDEVDDPFENDDLREHIRRSLVDRQWCRQDAIYPSESEALASGWATFKHHVKYKARYFFSEVLDDDEKYRGLADIPPEKMMARLASALRGAAMTSQLPAGTLIYRGRRHSIKTSLSTATELGPAPVGKSTSTRMTAAGIPAFYGALDPETQLAELGAVQGPDATSKPVATVGTFRTTRPLLVIDLRRSPELPDLYEPERRRMREVARFLASFTAEVSLPIVKDGREHVDYVPTQIVAEHLRHLFRDAEERQVDGILYQSARRPGGTCCVLFCGADACVDHDASNADTSAWIVLERGSPTVKPIPADR